MLVTAITSGSTDPAEADYTLGPRRSSLTYSALKYTFILTSVKFH